MKTMKLGVVLLALLLAAMAMVPMVSADTDAGSSRNSVTVTPVPTVNASDLTRFCGGNTCPMPVIVSAHIKKNASRTVSQTSQKVDSSFFMQDDISTYLKTWNEKMHWGLSPKQIGNLTPSLESGILTKYRDSPYPGYLYIRNMTEFCFDVGTAIGLTDEQKIAFAATSEEVLLKGKMKFEQPQTESSLNQMRSISATTYVNASSQSAPYGYGNSVYVYIFTEFTTASPSPNPTGGYWNTSAIENATQLADTGIYYIEDHAPSQANMDVSSMMYRTTVNGKNDGNNVSANGFNGWIETAAYNLGYRDENADGRQTDELARFIKLVFGADSVSLIYLTPDAQGGWALPPEYGYADKAVVSYWGKNTDVTPTWYYPSIPQSYEHESLHLLGAMDEYVRNESYCNEPSFMAVSPMSEFYTNSNHESCLGSVNSVMRYPFNTSVINQSSKNFIGWGDHDADGILDPLDSTP